MNTPEQAKHFNTISAEINAKITEMAMTYDTKTLAVALLLFSAGMLRAVHSAKIWTVEDVKAVIDAALQDVYTPLPKEDQPRIATIGIQSRPN